VEESIEEQFLKILNKLSLAEKEKNRALVRQTSRLVNALLCLKAMVLATNERKVTV
jgi:hypothetical protein